VHSKFVSAVTEKNCGVLHDEGSFLYRETCCLGKNGSILTHQIQKAVEELKSWLQQTNKQT
jgi:hypothetical protein